MESTEVDRTVSADIPIPKEDSKHIDVTEETWFENERDGSLDQESFHIIQRQLFGKPSYLANRMMDSPSRGASKEKTPSTPKMEKLDNNKKPVTPLQEAGDHEHHIPLQFPLDLEEIEDSNKGTNHFKDQTSILSTDGLYTPPRRERRSTSYLVEVGLLKEAGMNLN